MFLISKNGDTIINMDNVTKMYAGTNTPSINAEFCAGASSCIGRYDTRADALAAMQIISKELASRQSIAAVPSNKAVEAEILKRDDKTLLHSTTGKKIHGHGGS